MSLKVNVGVSRKLGLPGFSSVGASCQVELELDGGWSRLDAGRFEAKVREAFDDELDRLRSAAGARDAIVSGPATPGHPRHGRDIVRPMALTGPHPIDPPRPIRSGRSRRWRGGAASTWAGCCAPSGASGGPRIWRGPRPRR